MVGAVRRGGRTCNVAVEDASRTELEPLRRAVSAALGAGADRIFLCDTVGAWTPARAAARVAAVAECFPGVPLGVHCHNDLGMATANTVAAVEAGCRWPTVTVNGVGERAGNASLGEVAGACEQLLDLTGGLDLSGLVAISRTVERLTGFVVPQHQPLVGWNAFRHESGIHVDGLMKEARTYESLAPERLGREHHFVVGKHSGRALLVQYAQEHGLPDDAETIEDVLEIVKHRRPDWARESFARVRAALDGYNRSCLGVPAGQLDALFDEVGRSRRCQP